MEWSEIYPPGHQPTLEAMGDYIGDGFWQDLNGFLQKTYAVPPKIEYSQCSMQRGWNVKYKKRGKSLCTLYPMAGHFIALVVVGNQELTEAEHQLPFFSGYLRKLFEATPFSASGKWLMIRVTDPQILDDVKNLIQIRVKP